MAQWIDGICASRFYGVVYSIETIVSWQHCGYGVAEKPCGYKIARNTKKTGFRLPAVYPSITAGVRR